MLHQVLLIIVSLMISMEALQGSVQTNSVAPTVPQSSVPLIKANVRQVLVPFIVTDKKGWPVSGLNEAAFSIFEDGVPQKIVAFRQTYDASLESMNPSDALAGPAAPSVAQSFGKLGPNSPARTYLVCVDTLHSSISNIAQARQALTKFFQNEHDEKAQYALMSLGRQLDVLQDSTRDVSSVLAALSGKRFQKSILEGESSNIAFESAKLLGMLSFVIPESCQGHDNCSALKQKVQMFIDASAERTAILTRLFLQELKTILTAMADMPTQRTLVLISDGFNLVPGRELFGIASAFFPGEPPWRFNERDSQQELNELLRLAQKHNITVAALDSRGVFNEASVGINSAANGAYVKSDHAGADVIQNANSIAWENGSAMAQLAAATGGVYFHGNNNLLAGIHRAFDDERERYVIAYSPTNTSLDGKYRKITVEIKDKNLRVHAKAGYWASAE